MVSKGDPVNKIKSFEYDEVPKGNAAGGLYYLHKEIRLNLHKNISVADVVFV